MVCGCTKAKDDALILDLCREHRGFVQRWRPYSPQRYAPHINPKALHLSSAHAQSATLQTTLHLAKTLWSCLSMTFGYFVGLRMETRSFHPALISQCRPTTAGAAGTCFQHQAGKYQQCGYFWSCKFCPVCDHDNDITARYCKNCSEELIDPSAKLVELHTRAKKRPHPAAMRRSAINGSRGHTKPQRKPYSTCDFYYALPRVYGVFSTKEATSPGSL